MRALNDRGDDTPEGELTDDILDQLAKYERAKTAERSRRGKLQKARQSKVVAGPRPNFGFAYNTTRDNYVVDEERMQTIRRIFREVGAEGRTMYAVKRVLDREGVKPPSGGRLWSLKYIRDRINDDVYPALLLGEPEGIWRSGTRSPRCACGPSARGSLRPTGASARAWARRAGTRSRAARRRSSSGSGATTRTSSGCRSR